MRPEERKDFLDWHATTADQVFDFQKELIEYCEADVEVLARGCLMFREKFLDISKGVDPFQFNTLASCTMGLYKSRFLQETWNVVTLEENEDAQREERPPVPQEMPDAQIDPKMVFRKEFVSSPIMLVPATGLTNRDNYSKISIQWLTQESLTQNIFIQHALNAGEKRIGRYRVDGFCEETNTIYEFLGCFYHGCPTCYPNNDVMSAKSGETAQVLHKKTMARLKELQRMGYTVKYIWEHKFRQDMPTNLPEVMDRLKPQDALHGGRTNACKLFYECGPQERIRYVDFTSLYPYVMKYKKYPVGAPEIITHHFNPDFRQYFGLAKVKILPPKHLYHAVLPYVCCGKLVFPLCRTCAENSVSSSCTCSDEERAFVDTWSTPEINTALDHGYTLLKVYEVYHFKDSKQYDPTQNETGLFSDFINALLKVKQEASGWPSEYSDKAEYISDYENHEKIRLDEDRIEKNPGLRSVAKLLLNSFWGKFAQRNNLPKSEYVYTETELFQKLLDSKKNVKDFNIISPELCSVISTKAEHYEEEHTHSNVFIAAFTTCWARLELYQLLNQLQHRVLYFDTDSVVFVEDLQTPISQHLPIGSYLGQLTDEIPGHFITCFVSGGPKNYAYQLEDGTTTCKVKGFTLNYANNLRLNFEVMKNLLLRDDSTAQIQMCPANIITRNKRSFDLVNVSQAKMYKTVFTKRRRVDNYDSVPFGFVDNV